MHAPGGRRGARAGGRRAAQGKGAAPSDPRRLSVYMEMSVEGKPGAPAPPGDASRDGDGSLERELERERRR